MNMSNSDEFMDAFSEIEKYLRISAKSNDKYDTFYRLIDKAKTISPAVRQYETDLRELADLRNAITHERTDGHPIAEPYSATVSLIKSIARILKNPPKARSFQKEVVKVLIRDKLEKVLKDIKEHSYSQIPVYDGEEYRGILTTNAIARFISDISEEGIAMFGNTEVGEVLEHAEASEFAAFVGIDDDLFKVLEKFTEHRKNRKKLEAIIITSNGDPNKKPIGIITAWDIPEILERIDPVKC
jgi:CBS domain-containing protein